MFRQPKPAPDAETIQMALRSISETRRILEEVVTSSESFDYIRARQGLKQLQKMIRQLGREETRLRTSVSHQTPGGCAEVLPFPGGHQAEEKPAEKQPHK